MANDPVSNRTSNDAVNMLTDLTWQDPRGGAWCAVLCVRTIGHLMPPDAAPIQQASLRIAAAWAEGMTVSYDRMHETRIITHWSEPQGPTTEAVTCAILAAESIHDEALRGDGSEQPPPDSMRQIGSASRFVSTAVRLVLGILARSGAEAPMDDLVRLLAYQITPLAHPGSTPLGDWLLERDAKPGRVGSLSASLAWAREHRLRWWDPAQRWAAEHRMLPPANL
ncbi:MAG: hypothetical protein AAGA48_03290 [Myxococcota bacterium]